MPYMMGAHLIEMPRGEGVGAQLQREEEPREAYGLTDRPSLEDIERRDMWLVNISYAAFGAFAGTIAYLLTGMLV